LAIPGDASFGEETLPGGSSLARVRRGLPPEEDGVLKDIHFTLDSYELSTEARAILAENLEWLKGQSRATLEIEGHCDDRGTIEYNLALGARRAKAVKDYLAALGVTAERMATISYGEELPVCQERAESCWQRNRRAHFVILTP
jgi:peptidoglycan-associated lipoprotein